MVGLHRHYVAAGRQLHAWLNSALSPGRDVIMLPLPMCHVYANVGVQPLALLARAPLSLVPNPRDLGDLLKTIQQVKPTFFNGIPTLYTAILNHPMVRSGKVDLSSIKLCFSGAAALMAETKRRFEEATGARIVEGYSLTEGMMACCVNPVKGPNKIGSIGLPLPGRRRPNRRRRTRHARDAGRRSGRADHARAPAHGGILEQPRLRRAKRSARMATGGRGSTRATSRTWMTRDTSSWSIARKT